MFSAKCALCWESNAPEPESISHTRSGAGLHQPRDPSAHVVMHFIRAHLGSLFSQWVIQQVIYVQHLVSLRLR